MKDLFYLMLIMFMLLVLPMMAIMPFIQKTWHFQEMEQASEHHAEIIKLISSQKQTSAEMMKSMRHGKINRGDKLGG